MSDHKDIDEAEALMGSQIREYGEWVNVGTIKTTNILALLRELRDRREAFTTLRRRIIEHADTSERRGNHDRADGLRLAIALLDAYSTPPQEATK